MFSIHFLLSALYIVFIDLLLAGDNALVIAMAVRALPRGQRRWAIVCGAGAAVLLRVLLTIAAARLLELPYLQLAGGLLILWIAVKVLADASDPPDATPAPRRLLRAIWVIVLADITMSVDNVLAIAGASGGHVELIVFGLALSIPFVVFSSNLLANLMDRYPVLIYIGAGILGRVAGEMILTDPVVAGAVHPSRLVRYGVEAVLIAAVLLAGRRLCHMKAQRRASGLEENPAG